MHTVNAAVDRPDDPAREAAARTKARFLAVFGRRFGGQTPPLELRVFGPDKASQAWRVMARTTSTPTGVVYHVDLRWDWADTVDALGLADFDHSVCLQTAVFGVVTTTDRLVWKVRLIPSFSSRARIYEFERLVVSDDCGWRYVTPREERHHLTQLAANDMESLTLQRDWSRRHGLATEAAILDRLIANHLRERVLRP